MPVAKFSCPECKAVLRPAKPLPSGKKVNCPKCKAVFTVTDPDEGKAIKAGKPGGKPAPLSKNDPLYDDGPETYAVIKEEEQVEDDEDEDEDEDEDGKPKPKKPRKDRARMEDLEFRLNTDIPDPRGPAQAAVISPSNLLMLVATLACLVGIWSVFRGAWPFLFLEDIVDATDFNGPAPKDIDDDEKPREKQKTATQKKLFPVKDKTNELDFERLSPEQKQQYNDKRDEVWLWDVGYIIVGAILIAYNTVIIIGGVKMQNMEVYPLAMTASIMALGLSFPGLGQLAGFICISTLRSKKVLDGWFYIPPSATPHKKEKKREVL
jgi:hypothetical protein